MSRKEAWILDINRIGYEEAFDLQKKLVSARAAGEVKDTFILLEHFPVFTANRETTLKNIIIAVFCAFIKSISVTSLNIGKCIENNAKAAAYPDSNKEPDQHVVCVLYVLGHI